MVISGLLIKSHPSLSSQAFEQGLGTPLCPLPLRDFPSVPLVLQAVLAEQPQVLSYLFVPLHQFLLTWQEQKSPLYLVNRCSSRHEH